MARLKEYNGHYCESEYEYAFIGFLEAEGWRYSSGNNIRRVTKRDVLIGLHFRWCENKIRYSTYTLRAFLCLA